MAKRQKTFFIIVAILLGIAIGALIWTILTPDLVEGVFYYKVDGDKAKIFLLSGKKDPEEITSIPAREVDLEKYKPPLHSYLSNNGKYLIYFKKVGEEPIEEVSDENIIVARTISKPVLVNFKTGKETKIDQLIDSSGIVFSPSDEKIAWIKEVGGVTYQDIEQSGSRRELWVSRADGEGAELLNSFDENVVLLRDWIGNYIYFQGLWDVNIRSFGRVNIKTREIDYLVPKNCEKFLENCKDIYLSSFGDRFLYSIYTKEEEQEITALYLGEFEKREFLEILTTDRISDLLWRNQKEFFYTEQEIVKKQGMKEKIHLVNIKDQTDDIVYEGSYISQLTIDPNERYLYFLEKQKEGEDFNLVRLDIKSKEKAIILSGNSNHILLIK